MQLGGKRPRWLKWALRTSLVVLALFICSQYVSTSTPHVWTTTLRRDNAALSAVSQSPPKVVQVDPRHANITWAFVVARHLAGSDHIDIYSFAAGSSGNHAHLYSRVLEDEGLQLKCRGSLISDTVNATNIFDGDAPRMLLHRCPVAALRDRLSLRLEIWRHTSLVATIDPQLSPVISASLSQDPLKTNDEVEICLSPSFGAFDLATLAEWRIHHSRLGIESVHWYYRPETSHLLPVIQELNNILGTRDTVRSAPYLAEESVRNASQLHKHGAYSDQVPYHMDCLARVSAIKPAPWVAIIDADEYILPEPFNKSAKNAVGHFVAHSKKKTASLCIGRTGFRGPAILTANELESPPPPGTSAWRLLYLGTFKPYQSIKTEYNIKCFHKSDAIELAFTHWPERFLPNQPRKEVTWLEKHHPGVPRIAHLREVDRYMSPYSFPNKITKELKEWVKSLAVDVQAVLERMSSQASSTAL